MALQAAGGAFTALSLLIFTRRSFPGLLDTEEISGLPTGPIRYFYWIRPYFFPAHKFTMLAFVLALVVLALTTAVVLRIIANAQRGRRHPDQLPIAMTAAVLGFFLAFSAFALRLSPGPIVSAFCSSSRLPSRLRHSFHPSESMCPNGWLPPP